MASPLVVDERDTGFARIALRFDEAREPRLTLRVELLESEHVIEVSVPEEKAMDAFIHPFAYLPRVAAVPTPRRTTATA